MERNPKIKELDELAVILAGRGDKKAVLCHGVFDLLHIGHIRHFQQARQAGDILVVTLTPDTFVDKGPQRPAFPQDLRLEGIASLDCVDYVALNPWPTADNLLRKLKPDFYAKGAEFKNAGADRVGKIAGELAVLDEIGASMIFTEDIVFSSSNLINRYFSNQSREHQEYMGLFRQRHSLEGIQKVLDDMAGLKVLVLGDTILDEYQYGDVVGKSSKDPVLAMRYKSQDLFAGGVQPRGRIRRAGGHGHRARRDGFPRGLHPPAPGPRGAAHVLLPEGRAHDHQAPLHRRLLPEQAPGDLRHGRPGPAPGGRRAHDRGRHHHALHLNDTNKKCSLCEYFFAVLFENNADTAHPRPSLPATPSKESPQRRQRNP